MDENMDMKDMTTYKTRWLWLDDRDGAVPR